MLNYAAGGSARPSAVTRSGHIIQAELLVHLLRLTGMCHMMGPSMMLFLLLLCSIRSYHNPLVMGGVRDRPLQLLTGLRPRSRRTKPPRIGGLARLPILHLQPLLRQTDRKAAKMKKTVLECSVATAIATGEIAEEGRPSEVPRQPTAPATTPPKIRRRRTLRLLQ